MSTAKLSSLHSQPPSSLLLAGGGGVGLCKLSFSFTSCPPGPAEKGHGKEAWRGVIFEKGLAFSSLVTLWLASASNGSSRW